MLDQADYRISCAGDMIGRARPIMIGSAGDTVGRASGYDRFGDGYGRSCRI